MKNFLFGSIFLSDFFLTLRYDSSKERYLYSKTDITENNKNKRSEFYAKDPIKAFFNFTILSVDIFDYVTDVLVINKFYNEAVEEN